MYVVALVRLGSAPADEAKHLSRELGLAPYEATQLLLRGTPTITLRTNDRREAELHLANLSRRGHEAVGFDASAVVPSSEMGEVRTFAFRPEALSVEVRGRAEMSVPYEDFLCFVRAVHRVTERHTEVKAERVIDFRKIALTGGLMMSKTLEKEQTTRVEEREHVLYVFRRTAQPLLLGAQRAKYTGLGEELRPTQLANFERTIELLRSHAPFAPYDARLVTLRTPQSHLSVSARGQETVSSAGVVDVLAHVVAMALSRSGENPYRDAR